MRHFIAGLGVLLLISGCGRYETPPEVREALMKRAPRGDVLEKVDGSPRLLAEATNGIGQHLTMYVYEPPGSSPLGMTRHLIFANDSLVGAGAHRKPVAWLEDLWGPDRAERCRTALRKSVYRPSGGVSFLC